MDQKTVELAEAQFKRIGLQQAFTPEVIQQMKEGAIEIKVPYSKVYKSGEKADGVLHVKKSGQSDAYYLNGFDVTLQRDGQANTLKQYFSVNPRNEWVERNGEKVKEERAVHFTWKKAVNFLAGRPVYNTLYNKEGEEYKAWEVINYKAITAKGNFESKPYYDSYGFNLEAVLAKYAIKDMTVPAHKDKLIENLHRGNLQLVTLVGEGGKEEKLFITPSIKTGTIKIYDANKVLVPIATLVEKGYIGQDFAKEQKERFTQKKSVSEGQAQPADNRKQQQGHRP